MDSCRIAKFLVDFMDSVFIINSISTVAGGLILAIALFIIREKIYPLPAIAGRWYFEMHTNQSSYNKYEGMSLKYEAILCPKGNVVQGTAEKFYEVSSTGKREYTGKDRTRSTISGYIEKNYFSKDRLFLHFVEKGSRESTYCHDLVCTSKKIMKGSFVSMVAKQSGAVIWRKDT